MPRRTVNFNTVLVAGSSCYCADAREFAQKVLDAVGDAEGALIMIDSSAEWEYGSQVTRVEVSVSGRRAMTAKDRQRLRAEEKERKDRQAALEKQREDAERAELARPQEKYK